VSLLREVADAGANILEVVHERTSAELHLDEVEVLLQMETRGGEHTELVIGKLRDCGYRVVEMS
jgi:threonine dehydratase